MKSYTKMGLPVKPFFCSFPILACLVDCFIDFVLAFFELFIFLGNSNFLALKFVWNTP